MGLGLSATHRLGKSESFEGRINTLVWFFMGVVIKYRLSSALSFKCTI